MEKKYYDPHDRRMETRSQMRREGEIPGNKKPDRMEHSVYTKKPISPKQRLQHLQKKYKGRFSRGEKPKPSPKHGFRPRGTTEPTRSGKKSL